MSYSNTARRNAACRKKIERLGSARVARESIGTSSRLDVSVVRVAFPVEVDYNGTIADKTQPSPSPVVPQTVPHTPAVAIWSLILAVLSFTCGWVFTAVPAVICGHIARAKIRKSGGALGGKGIATAGLILGYIALVLGIVGTSAAYQHDPVGSRAVASAFHRTKGDRFRRRQNQGYTPRHVDENARAQQVRLSASRRQTQSNVFDCSYRGES